MWNSGTVEVATSPRVCKVRRPLVRVECALGYLRKHVQLTFLRGGSEETKKHQRKQTHSVMPYGYGTQHTTIWGLRMCGVTRKARAMMISEGEGRGRHAANTTTEQRKHTRNAVDANTQHNASNTAHTNQTTDKCGQKGRATPQGKGSCCCCTLTGGIDSYTLLDEGFLGFRVLHSLQAPGDTCTFTAASMGMQLSTGGAP